MTPDPYLGLTAEDRARAVAHTANQVAIARKRREAARRLLAPNAPAEAVRAAWAPLRAVLDERRAGGGR